MLKIKVFMNGENGVTYHRLYTPYTKLQEMYPNDIEVSFWNFEKNEEEFNDLHNYNYFVFSRLCNPKMLAWIRYNCDNTKIICDMDDYWVLDSTHPLYQSYKQSNMTAKLTQSLQLADYITTTNNRLKSKILPFNKFVKIFPNCVAFRPERKPNNTGRLRLGIIGGSSHTNDMKLLDGITNQLPKDVLDKVQFVLCGFDAGYYKDGEKKVQLPYSLTCWGNWEKNLTDNYTTISNEHLEFLNKYEKTDYETNEAYKRIWTKSIYTYHTNFDEVDVLLIPLQENDFNRCKSALKLAEAGAKEVAVICSDVEPYKEYLKDGINCIAVNVRQKTKGFAKAITKLVKNPDLLDTIKAGLKETVNDNFNIDKITEDRKKWLEEND